MRVETRAQMRVETFTFEDDGGIPNSPLPVLVYHDALEADADAAAYEDLFAGNGWLGAWRDGIYPVPPLPLDRPRSARHRRRARERDARRSSRPDLRIGSGDVVVLPAGTGHRNLGASADLLVVGAYPDAMRWDLRRGDPGEHGEVLANIAHVPLPDQDPVAGADGPLVEMLAWRGLT